jgi:hypothetical protein
MVAIDTTLGLDKVRLKKDELLKKLEENLGKHTEEFKEAHAGWKKTVLVEMKKNLMLAEEGKKWNLIINEAEPEDYSVWYRRIIALLKASIDDVIFLTQGEFRQYYLDEWNWKDAHTNSVSNYSSRR